VKRTENIAVDTGGKRVPRQEKMHTGRYWKEDKKDGMRMTTQAKNRPIEAKRSRKKGMNKRILGTER
jgi:hypothetical protein